MRKYEYEYAGFQYIVTEEGGKITAAEALPGQHPAAYKDRHRRSAIEQAQDDLGKKPG